jgi:lipid A 3-O-deacylase
MRGGAVGVAVFGAMMALAPEAKAEIDEVHVGVMAHNICVTDCKNADHEDGPNLELQVSFDSPRFLRWKWRWEFAEGWAFEPGIGYVVHNGAEENPYPGGSPEAAAFAENNLLLGSNDLFRSSFGLTRDFEGPWEAQLFFTHHSHGQIIGNGHNQAIDQVGVRFGYQFGQ